MYVVHTEVVFVKVQRSCWLERQLLLYEDDGVCCYTGRYLGTECNNDTTAANTANKHPTVPTQLFVATQPARRRQCSSGLLLVR
jgi:hypothetical protein